MTNPEEDTITEVKNVLKDRFHIMVVNAFKHGYYHRDYEVACGLPYKTDKELEDYINDILGKKEK